MRFRSPLGFTDDKPPGLMHWSKKASLVAVAGLFAVAAGLVLYGTTMTSENRFHGSVASLLPEPPAGWTVTARPIAQSLEMREAVGEILNYDDAVFVDYTYPSGNRLSVYLAYWRAGKMATKEVATHTPDVCWVGNGWIREFGARVETWSDGPVPAGEARVFTIGEVRERVLFWHIVGGEVVSYGTMEHPPWYAPFTEVFRNGLSLRKEQFFIRLSSAQPLDSEALRPLMDQMISQVRELAPEALRTED